MVIEVAMTWEVAVAGGGDCKSCGTGCSFSNSGVSGHVTLSQAFPALGRLQVLASSVDWLLVSVVHVCSDWPGSA